MPYRDHAAKLLNDRDRRKRAGFRALRKTWHSNDHRNQSRHHLPLEEFNRLKALGCGICKMKFTEAKPPHIDHDHRCCAKAYSCGKCVRGLLCATCNNRLARFRDSVPLLHAAIEYLKGGNMSTVKDANGNVLNQVAPQLAKYKDANGLVLDWFDTHPRPEVPVSPKYEDENGKTWLYNPATKKWDIPEPAKEVVISPAIRARIEASGQTLPKEAVKLVLVEGVPPAECWDKKDAAPNSNNDVPSVQLPSERSDAGLAGGQAIPEPTSPSGDTKSDVVKATPTSK